jgi:hypothetical protein
VFSDASDGGFGDALATAGVARRSSAADLLELDALCAAAEAAAPASGPALAVPDWPKGMRLVLETDVDTSLEALVECIWSDAAAADGGFVKCVCAARGESEVRITPWGAARGGGFQRDFTFRCVAHTPCVSARRGIESHRMHACFLRVFSAPVKGSARSFGPKSTYCHQTQHCRRYGPPAFVLRTSQVMNDIPYGDYFRRVPSLSTQLPQRWLLCIRSAALTQTRFAASVASPGWRCGGMCAPRAPAA